jgi:hypothetical protein
VSKPEAVVDHLLLGVSDLDQGVDWVEKLTGVRAIPGGSHPGAGTRNALIALGDRRYLEIVAPDPAQTTYAFPVDVRALKEPRLVSWAMATTDPDQLLLVAREAGYTASSPQPGSRARPDGKLLKWNLVRVRNPFACDGIQPFPFFIEWAEDSRHPSADSPTGCELVSLRFEHPDASNLAVAFRRFGIEAQVTQAKQAALKATVRIPNGQAELR